MSGVRTALGVAALAVLLTSCGDGTSSHQSSSPTKRKIIFTVSGYLPPWSGREACSGLYAVNADGSGLVRLTGPLWDANAAEPLIPAQAGVPGLIGFTVVGRSGSAELFAMDTPTGRIDRITSVNMFAGEVGFIPPIAWAPDGKSLLTLEKVGRRSVLQRVAVGGFAQPAAPARGSAFFPSWSSNGTIGYSLARRDGTWSVWQTNWGGGNRRRVAANASDTKWSPDGRRFAFFRPGPLTLDGVELWVADRDGGNARRIARDVIHSIPGVVWSRDSERLLFVRRSSDSFYGQEYDAGDLFAKDVESGVERLVKRHVLPVGWFPNGREILFLRPLVINGDGVWRLYRSPLRGGRETLLTVIDDADAQLGSLPILQTQVADVVPVTRGAGGASERFEIRRFGFSCLGTLRRLRDSLTRPPS